MNILYKNPQIYELVFPIKNPYAFKNFYFTISLNSEEVQSSNVRLFYRNSGVLDTSLAIEQKLALGQRGGFNVISLGYKKNDFQINLKYQFNEMVYFETSEDREYKFWDKIFGKITDTIYVSNTRVILNYNFDSLYRVLNLTSSGNFSILSNPITVEFGYKNFLISGDVRIFNQNGSSIEYSAKNYALSFSPEVNVLEPSNYQWKAYVSAIPYIPNPFTLKRTFDIENAYHFSIYLSYFDKSTLLRIGYSPSLKINCKVSDQISYIKTISNTVDSVRYDETNSRLSFDGNEITGLALIYVFFNYKDTTYNNQYEFSYQVPQNFIFEFYRGFRFKFIDFNIFLGQSPLNNLYAGFSLIHRLYAKTFANYGYIYNKNSLFDVNSLFFNAVVPTGSFLFSFGAKLNFSNSMEDRLKEVLKNYIVSYEQGKNISFGLNLQITYLK